MNEPLSLRTYARALIDNLDNPNYATPEFAPYVPPTPQLPPYYSPLYTRKPTKVYTVPTAGTPSVLSPDMRKRLDDLFEGLDDPIEPAIIESATLASEENHARYERGLALSRIAAENVAKVAELRDAFRHKDVMATPAAAIAKLGEIPVQGKFVVPDNMAHNMQALVSKRNQRENGKRYKTARVNGDKSFLQVWRTR